MEGRSLARYLFLFFNIVFILLITLINLPYYSPPNYEADDCATTTLSPWCNSVKNRRIKQLLNPRATTNTPPTTHSTYSTPFSAQNTKLKLLNLISIEQLKGLSFTVKGHLVKWENWEFHLKPDPRAGVIISRAMVHDPGTGEFRNVMYKGFSSELFVPYVDNMKLRREEDIRKINKY